MKKNNIARMKTRTNKLAAGVLALVLGMLPWNSPSVHAADKTFNVGPDQIIGGDNFRTLEGFRISGYAVDAGSSNTVIFTGSAANPFDTDKTLTAALNLGGSPINSESFFFLPDIGSYSNPADGIHVAGGGGAASFVNITGGTPATILDFTGIGIGSFTGSAVKVVGFDGTVNIRDGKFKNNTVTGQGGAVFAENASDVNIDHTEFDGNKANGTNGQGGAVYIKDSQVDVGIGTNGGGNVFSNNTAAQNGGAVSVLMTNNADKNVIKVVIQDSNFTGNTATSGRGGAIYMENINNSVQLQISAVEQDVEFNGNTAGNGSAGLGQDIYLKNTDAVFNLLNGHSISINGGLDSDSKSSLEISGDGKVQFNADSTIGENLTVIGNTAVLAINNGSTIAVAGNTIMDAGATLSINSSDKYINGAALTTDTLTAMGQFTIDLTGFGGDTSVNCNGSVGTTGIYTLVDANQNIDKTKYNIVGINSSGTLDEEHFLRFQEIKNDSNKDKIQIGGGVVWGNTGVNDHHGTFYIDGPCADNCSPADNCGTIVDGKVFTLNVNLADNNSGNGLNGWDGKTLKKTGSGTLVLNGTNTYTGGSQVKEGYLVAAHQANGIIDSAGSGTVTVDAGATFQVGAYGISCTTEGSKSLTAELTNNISGAGNFAVSAGNGTITVNNSNGYTGKTTVWSGTLKITNANALGGSLANTTANNGIYLNSVNGEVGKLELALANNQTLSRIISGNGSLIKSEGNTVTVTGNNTSYTGKTIINNGTLIAHSVDNADSIIKALGNGEVAVSANGNLKIDVAGTFKNQITGAGDIETSVADGKEVVLDDTGHPSTYTGETNVSSGNLRIKTVTSTGSNTTTAGAVNLIKDTTTFFIDGNGIYNKEITGEGNLIKETSGELILTNGKNNYKGGTTVANEDGILTLTHVDAAGSGDIDLQTEGSKLQVKASGTFDNLIHGNGDAVFAPPSGKTLTVSGNNDYDGHTTIQNGTVKLTNLNGTGVNTGTKQVTIEGDAELDLATGGTYNKQLDGDGTLVKSTAALVTLTGSNTHGATHLKNGETDITDNNALGRGIVTMENDTTLGYNTGVNRVSNDFRLNGNATIDTKGGVSQNVLMDGVIYGQGKLTKIDAGTVELTGNNEFSGGLDINGGRIKVRNQTSFGDGIVTNNSELELYLDHQETLKSDKIDSTNGKFIKSGTGGLVVDKTFTTKQFDMTEGGNLTVVLDKPAHITATNGFTFGGNATLTGKIVNSAGLDRGEGNAKMYLALEGTGSNYFSKSSGNALIDTGTLKHIKWSTSQTGNLLYYQLWADSYSESYSDQLSDNGREAANGADNIPSGDPIIDALDRLKTADDIVKAFDELHGEIYKTAMYAEADMQRNFNEIILRRGLLCEDCYCFKGFRGQSRNEVGRREMWATFTGGGNFRSNVNRYSGYNAGRWGVVAGMEQMFARGWFAGGAFGYDKADLSLSKLPSKDSFYAARFSGYLNYTYEQWSTIGFIGYAKNWHEVDRNITFMNLNAKSRYDDDICTFGAETRYLIHANTIDFIPTAGFTVVDVDTPYIAETGANSASLRLQKDSYNSFRVPIGFRANSRFDVQDITLRPEIRMFYVTEWGDSKIRGLSSFAADSSKTFMVDSGISGHSGFRIGAGVEAKVFDRMLLGFDYDAELWNGYSRHDVGGHLTVRW